MASYGAPSNADTRNRLRRAFERTLADTPLNNGDRTQLQVAGAWLGYDGDVLSHRAAVLEKVRALRGDEQRSKPDRIDSLRKWWRERTGQDVRRLWQPDTDAPPNRRPSRRPAPAAAGAGSPSSGSGSRDPRTQATKDEPPGQAGPPPLSRPLHRPEWRQTRTLAPAATVRQRSLPRKRPGPPHPATPGPGPLQRSQ